MNRFSDSYPYISSFIETEGYISFGNDEFFTSWIRAFNVGGTVHEVHDAKNYDDAINQLEKYFREDFENEWGRRIEI